MRTLVLVSGISDHSYMREELKKSKLYDELSQTYNNIIDVDYQHIMDKYAICFKSLGDPLRLMFTPFGHDAQKHVERSLQTLKMFHGKIDVMSHSQGSWMTMRCNVDVNNYYCIASPIGFAGVIGRTAVQLNIGSPKIRAKRFYNIFSSKDFVSSHMPRDLRWDVGNSVTRYIDTGTSHSLVEYAEVLERDYLTIFH